MVPSRDGGGHPAHPVVGPDLAMAGDHIPPPDPGHGPDTMGRAQVSTMGLPEHNSCVLRAGRSARPRARDEQLPTDRAALS